jgi:hypothetical protein
MQQGQELVDRLTVVRLIEQTIELRGRGSKPSDNFALRQGACLDSLLRLNRQLIQQHIPQVVRILVVFQHLLTVDRFLLARFQHLDEPFIP